MLKTLIATLLLIAGFHAQAEQFCGILTSVTRLDQNRSPERDAALLIRVRNCTDKTFRAPNTTFRVPIAIYDEGARTGQPLDVYSNQRVGQYVCVNYTVTETDLVYQSFAKKFSDPSCH